MKNRIGILIIFICSLITLVISVKLFVNMGIYVDETNTTPSIVYGGDFWLYMAWFGLFLSCITTLVSGIILLKKSSS